MDIAILNIHVRIKGIHLEWTYGVVVIMFDFHRSDRDSKPGRAGKIS